MKESWIPEWLKESVAPFLAILVITGGLVILWFKPEVKTETVALMVMVLQFYFGSSKSSQAKDDHINDQIKEKDKVIVQQLRAQ